MIKLSRFTVSRSFHFMGSAKTFFLMGNAIGEGMVELLKSLNSKES